MEQKITFTFRRSLDSACALASYQHLRVIDASALLRTLIGNRTSNASRLISALSQRLPKLSIAVDEIISELPPDCVYVTELPASEEVKHAIRAAVALSREKNDAHVGTEHLLTATFAREDAVSDRVAKIAGTTRKELTIELQKELAELFLAEKET